MPKGQFTRPGDKHLGRMMSGLQPGLRRQRAAADTLEALAEAARKEEEERKKKMQKANSIDSMRGR